jgi:hypothetical protein
VRLLAYGHPDAWILDAETDEAQRVRLGASLSFVVFVKGDPKIKVADATFNEPEGST